MKKVLLSMAVMMATSVSVFAQEFTNGDAEFTESFGASGTSCLKTCCTSGGYAFADGNVTTSVNTANEITLTAANPTVAGLAPGHFDFYYTNTVTDQCAAMRTANIGVDMSTGAPRMIVRAKASANGVTAQFHIAHAPNAYPSSTAGLTPSGVPTSQTEKTLTTSYADYVVDYSGPEWTNNTTAAFKAKINVWSVLIPADNALNNGATVTIESIRIGSDIVAANNNANVVNDQVTLFPNPAKSSFNVDMTAMNNSETATIKVMNANGMLVKELSSNNSTEVVTTEGLNKGIYMVQVTSGNKIATKKVVVE